MSEKKTESQESDEISKKELVKLDSIKKEQFSKSIENMKKNVEKIVEKHKIGTSQSIKTAPKIPTSTKSVDPIATETCQISKNKSEWSTSDESDSSEDAEDSSEDEEECQMSKSISKTSTSMQPTEISEVCQKPKTTSKSSTSSKTDHKITEICEIPKVTSEIYDKLSKYGKEICQAFKKKSEESAELEQSETPATKMSRALERSKWFEACGFEASNATRAARMYRLLKADESAKLETPEIPEAAEVCQMPKSTSEESIKLKFLETPEAAEMSTAIERSKRFEVYGYETSRATRMYEILKNASKKSAKLETLEISEAAKVCQMPKNTSKESAELEASETPEGTKASRALERSKRLEACGFIETSSAARAAKMYQLLKTASEEPAKFQIPEIPEAAKVSQMTQTTSEDSTELKALGIPETAKVRQMFKTTVEVSTCTESEDFDPNVAKMFKNPQEDQITSDPSKSILVHPLDKMEEAEVLKDCPICSSKITERCENVESCLRCGSTLPLSYDTKKKIRSKVHSADDIYTTVASAEDCKLNVNDSKSNLKASTKLEENLLEKVSMKSVDDTGKIVMIPIIEKVELTRDVIDARKFWPPMSAPNFNEHHLVLASHHLVPSLSFGLFEMFAEIIEVVTKKPVVLLHESRDNRPIAAEIADIVILPAAETWNDGVLLPASFVFEHRLNKDKSANLYADVIVAKDRAPHIQDIMDLRGHRCAVPNNRHQFSAAGLLFNYLYSKGENMMFFGHVLDGRTQMEVLEMVAGKQAEIGILESSVIRCNKYNVHGADSLHILTSLGPLPPYRIMIKNTLANQLAKELTAYLLNIDKNEEWLKRLSPYGVIGFAKNSMDYYNLVDKKCVETNVPYY
ncbi:PREDICTED: uncharacterized protein LOC108775882 [Cyphomyrmex costatus]|uniref:Uncharacterized protein n=1 Tax=Cyphomyrmex costatus TaxID=456900 RepID=A0A151IPX3_9HYME|nr:PREDICTED: uncharacterized protein LOC108775882 [Cyphomyrmex costatus]KYN08212.1 hypothetical protein ALC62_00826 [Cyphomyrmex costatus]